MARKTEFGISIKLIAEQFKSQLTNLQKNLVKFRNTVLKAFAGIGAIEFTKQIIQAGSEFESAMARVKAIAASSTNEFKAMEAEAMRLGRTTKYTATQAAQALESLVRLGLKPQEAVKALAGVLQLAQSQAIELNEAAQIAVTAMNSFGLKTSDLAHINDVLAIAASKSATNVLELFEALKIAGPTANAAGISIEETVAALGQLANVGYLGSDAGTGFKQVVLALASQTPEAVKIMKKYGYEVNETTLRTEGLIKTLQKLAQTGLGNSIADLGDYFNKLGAPKGAALLNNVTGVETLYGQIQDGNGAAQRMFDEGLGEYEKAIKTLISVYENTQVKVYNAFKDVFIEPVKTVTEFIKRIQDIPTAISIALTAGLSYIGKFVTNTKKQLTTLSEKQYYKKVAESKYKLDDAVTNNMLATNLTFYDDDLKLGNKNGIKQLLKQMRIDLPNVNKATEKGKEYIKIMQAINVLQSNTLKSTKKWENAYNLVLSKINEIHKTSTLTNLNEAQKAYDLLNSEEGKKAFMQQNAGVKALSRTLSQKVFATFKTIGTSILNFFGGWQNLLFTGILAAGNYFYAQWRKQGEALREASKEMQKASDENSKLSTSFQHLLNQMRISEKGSVQWKAALEAISRDYPDLLKKLNLEQVSVRQSADEYKKLGTRIKEVIEFQKQYNIASAASTAKQKLIDSYVGEDANNTLSKLTKNLEKRLTLDGVGENAAKIMANAFKSEVSMTLFNGDNEDTQRTKIIELYKKYWNNIDSSLKYADNFINSILNDSKKIRNEISKLDKIKFPEIKITSQNVDAILNEYYNKMKTEASKIQQIGNAQGWETQRIDKEIASIAQTLVDELSKKLQDINFTNEKGNTVNGLDYAKFDKRYTELLQKSKLNIDTRTPKDTAIDTLKDAETRYAQKLDSISLRYETETLSKLKKLYTAIDNLILAYETHSESMAYSTERVKSLTKEREILARKIKEEEDRIERSKEVNKYDNQTNKRLRSLSRQYGNVNSGMNRDEYSPWDYFSTNWKDFRKEEVDLERLRNKFEDIRSIRAQISDDDLEEAMKFKTDSAQQLLSFVNMLETDIKTLGGQFRELEGQLYFRKAQEEIKQLNKQSIEETYNGVKTVYNGFKSVRDIFSSFQDFNDMNAFDQFLTIGDALFSLIDTFYEIYTVMNNVTDAFKNLTVAKTTLDAAMTANSLAKSGEELGALASQTAAAVAASEAKIKAYQVEAAAGTAAAYSSIPFVGMGLAKAQYAQIMAMITAARALPAFSEGGFVPGNSIVGDEVLGRLNSKELVLTTQHQKDLWNLINGNSNKVGNNTINGDVKFKIDGTTLVGVLNNYNRKTSKVR